VGAHLIEFDVIESRGELVVAHGRGDVGPETPTLDEALRFFVDEAPDIGVHVDLKLTRRERDVVDALGRLDLVDRAFVSSAHVSTVRRVAELGGPRVGITIPRGVFKISDHGRSAPLARSGLRAVRRFTPGLVRPLLAITRATAVVLHHSVVTAASVRAAHACGAAVVAWTVDEPDELARVDEAGVDAVVTNDPTIFTSNCASTLET
jgi:glycerophosphoryl diester phosphodiesterase